MKHQLVAYLIQGDGEVSEMPTDELQVAFDDMAQESTLVGQSRPSENAGVYQFLQALKRAMQTAKP